MVKFSDKDQTWATLYYSERRDDFQCTSCGHEISDTSMIDDMPVDVTPSWHSVKYSIPCPECGGEAVCEVPLA